MTELFKALVDFLKQFRFFVVVLPWETVLRCRFGKHVKLWGPGWHFRIPFVDELHVVNTRLRVAIAPTQTLTTADRLPISVALSVGFSITDPMAALLRFVEPEQTVAAIAQTKVAEFISTRKLDGIVLDEFERYVFAALRMDCGEAAKIEFVRALDFVSAPTVRLLQEQWRIGTTTGERKI